MLNAQTAQQLIVSAVCSLGFCLLYNERSSRIPFILAGAVGSWFLYLAVGSAGGGAFACSLIASVCATAYGELLAHRLKAPVTVFLMPMLVPLVPGGMLYNALYSLITGDRAAYQANITDTVLVCLGIVLGITGVLFVIQYWKGRGRRAA